MQFLQRTAMVSYSIPVCLSIRLYARHTPVLCQNQWKYDDTVFTVE